MPNLEQFAMTLLKKNPNIANSPQGKQFMQILQNGDVAAGQQMAQNFCQAYGDTPEEAMKKAERFFFNQQ